jgi:gliding motility-associated lipoprotein GldD
MRSKIFSLNGPAFYKLNSFRLTVSWLPFYALPVVEYLIPGPSATRQAVNMMPSLGQPANSRLLFRQPFFRQPATLLFVTLLLTAFSCDRGYTPKPAGYIRVHYPEKEYVLFDEPGPFAFEVPVYADVLPADSKSAEPYWYDLKFPEYRGTVHISYKPVDGDVEGFIEDTRTLVYKHTSRADGILEVPFVDSENRRFGILYELGGSVASPVQFFLTDSTSHFLRGSLYFNAIVNRDSLNPIIRFVKQDIEHLIETVRWK